MASILSDKDGLIGDAANRAKFTFTGVFAG